MGAVIRGAATLSSGRGFMRGGRWATEQMVRALKAGRQFSVNELRTLELLTRDEWKVFDDVILEEAQIRLAAVGELTSRGLVKTIPNGLAKTVLEYEKMSDMEDAIVSLDGVTRDENDRVDFTSAGLPLPITHKDWYLNLRHLLASRTTGEPLDTTHTRVATRKVIEKVEDMLFNGERNFLGLPIYGLTTHPDRLTGSFGTGGAWTGSKTGAQIVADVGTMLAALEGNRMYGPYGVFVGGDASLKLQEDYKAESDITILARVLQYQNVAFVRVADKLADGNVVTVQLTPDVIQMVEGEPIQTIQWDAHGGMQINFKVMTIQIPMIRTDEQDRSGIYHMSA